MPLRTLSSLLATLVVLAGVAVSSPAHAADPIRILAAGDSITQGFHGDYTWRYRLAKEFGRQGVPVDFVGSRRDVTPTAGWTHSEYADPNFDRDHFAWSGVTLRVMASWIRAEVSSQDPDVLVLAAGVNDLRAGLTPQETNANLRKAITNARLAKPNLRIVVAPVLDARDPKRQGLASMISSYDSLARSTVSDMSTGQSPVVWADTTRGWQLTQYTIEDIHPNPTGEAHIGQRVGEALHGLGVLTGPPQVFRVLPWTRTSAVQATRSGTRLRLSWPWQGTTGSRVMMTRVGTPGAHYRWVRGGALTTAALVSGATYTFRVQLMRGRMTGPYGPTTRVTLPRASVPAPVARVVVDRLGAHWSRSSLATSYIVKFRKGNKKRWVTRRTTGLHVYAPKIKRARVWAVNAGGLSAVRAGAR